MSVSNLICIGKILGAHGVRGQAKIASFTDEPEDVASYGAVCDESGKKSWMLTLQGWNKDHFLGRLSGVDTREQVEALRGTKLFVARDVLPDAEDGSYYYTDLIGLEARLASGEVFGKVLSVQNYGASDILEIQVKGSSRKELIAFTNAFVPEVKLSEGYLTVIMPEITESEDLEVGSTENDD